MLEIYKKKNGEYENKSIKLNDLGMNQSIEFTPKFMNTGEGKFGTYYKVNGTYHTEGKDIEDVTIWASQGYYPKLEKNKDVRVKITKTKKEGAKFHTYGVEPVNGSSSFEFKTDDLKDEEGTYTDKEGIELIKGKGHFDNVDAYIKMWTGFGSTEERARQVFANRNRV